MTVDPALGQGLTELIELISHGDLAAARTRAATLLLRYPQQAELWRLSGICALQQGELATAQRALDRALELAPHSVEAWCNLASVYTARGRLDDAERALRRALAHSPDHAAALNNLGSLLDARGDYHGAAECFSKAIMQRPDYARAWLNQAAALLAVHQLDRAEVSARRAVQLAAQWGDAYFVLGNVLAAAGRAKDALSAYRDAIRCAPNDPRYYYQLGLILDEQNNLTAAVQAQEHALTHAKEFWPALSQLVYLKRRLCDWQRLAPLSRHLIDGVESGAQGITPFSFLVEDSTPAQQLACARQFAAFKQAQVAPLTARLAAAPRVRAPGPIRVGFLAAGFNDHPTALLIAELIERLQSSHLRTIGYATVADDGGELRKRLQQAFHEFYNLSGRSLEAMLRALRSGQLDILIDLDGYCGGGRPELLTLRAAPLQVNWLAYPGTLGAAWYDYMVADRFVIPDEQRAHYSEAIAWLPRCFQPSDTTRSVAEALPRARYGLPERSVVLASFNHSWKITFRTFARWTKILKAVPDAVLWLLAGPPGGVAEEHLRRAAHASGVEAQRLVFAPRVAHADHLARYRHVDLFLDSNPYNAHTTACDALWVGCPVLTQPGTTFASRVAGSLNHHLGLDDLNTATDQAYIEQAVHLARLPELLKALRQRIESAKVQATLFDMTGYARDFEALLTSMFRRHERGDQPRDFELTP